MTAITRRDLITFYPLGQVDRPSVFPTAKPQEDQMQIMRPRIADYSVHECVIDLALREFKQGPGNGHEHCIEVLRLKEGPHALHGFETGRRIVVDLSPEHQARFSIHNQLLDVSPFF
jgi:hypothetical protein